MDVDKIKVYADDITEEVLDQLKSVAFLPQVKRAALMPDAHLGYTVPIGSVLEIEGSVSPAIIGNDIGCGVMSVPLNLEEEDIRGREEEILEALSSNIKIHRTEHDRNFAPASELTEDLRDLYKKHRCGQQIGTLGGGNHFLEVGCSSLTGHIWITLHTGSRRLGNLVHEYYTRGDGSKMIPVAVSKGWRYLGDYNVALKYAIRNRQVVMIEAVKTLKDLMPDLKVEALWTQGVHRPHNFIERDGTYYTHRKGAIGLKFGQWGAIPANCIDGTFIVSALNTDDGTLKSAAHGVGRILGKRKAKKTLDLEEYKRDLDTNGVYTKKVHKKNLGEAPGAYRNTKKVMDAMIGKMVSIEDRLVPVISIKN